MRTDAIRLTQKQQALLRRQAIELRETGTSNKEVAQILGVHQKTVSGWWPAYRRIGSALFEPGKQGRRRGDKRKLTAPREREVPNRGVVRFLVYTGELDAAILVRFCGRLIVSTNGRMVRLILDHLPVHDTTVFKQWTNDHRHELIVFYLPVLPS